MLFDVSPPYYFGHRGASAYAPENTIEAFQLALEQGAQLIEFDVKLTADRQVAVIHDPAVDRTTDGTGKVNQLTMTELKRLDAGAWFGENFRGARIPSLDEVFEHLGNKLYMNVELTNYSSPFDRLVDEVASLVKRHGLEKRVLFSSFYPTNLIRAHQLLPETPRGQLTFSRAAGWWQRMWGAVIDVQADHPFTSDVTLESVSKSHKRGRLVHAWTVNDPEEMKRLCNLGVDGFFTDDPILARETLSQ